MRNLIIAYHIKCFSKSPLTIGGLKHKMEIIRLSRGFSRKAFNKRSAFEIFNTKNIEGVNNGRK